MIVSWTRWSLRVCPPVASGEASLVVPAGFSGALLWRATLAPGTRLCAYPYRSAVKKLVEHVGESRDYAINQALHGLMLIDLLDPIGMRIKGATEFTVRIGDVTLIQATEEQDLTFGDVAIDHGNFVNGGDMECRGLYVP